MKTKLLLILRLETLWRNAICLFIAAIFIFAGVMKLLDPAAFTQNIRNYRILSEFWSTFVAASLPWLEIMAGAFLFLPMLRLTASFLITGLMVVFTISATTALARGLDITCGCFGKALSEYASTGAGFLLRDIVLFILSATLLFLNLRDSGLRNR